MQWDWSQNDITFDQNCWTFDGYNGCAEEPSVPITGGPSRKKYYNPSYYEPKKNEITKREQEMIVDFIKVILTKGLI